MHASFHTAGRTAPALAMTATAGSASDSPAGLPPILLSVNPVEALDGDRQRLGGYLSALAALLLDLHTRMGGVQQARTPEERRRLRYKAVQYLMECTRRALLRRYWEKLMHSIGRGGSVHPRGERERAARLKWLEDEYKRVAEAVQDIMSLLERDREEKQVLQGSTERLALALGETQSQLSSLSNEISAIMFTANKLDFRRLRADFLLLSMILRAPLRRRYFTALQRFVATRRKQRTQQRKVRMLLQSTARCILRSRLHQWILFVQQRVARRIKRRTNVDYLRRKTDVARLRRCYLVWLGMHYRLQQHRRVHQREQRHRRHLRYLLLKNEKQSLFRWHYDMLRANVRRKKDLRLEQAQRGIEVLDAVTQQSGKTLSVALRELRQVKDRQKRMLARTVQLMQRRNVAEHLRPYYRALLERRRRGTLVRRFVRNVRYLMNKSALATLRMYYNKLQLHAPHVRREQRIKQTKMHDLAKKSWQVMGRRVFDKLRRYARDHRNQRRALEGVVSLRERNIRRFLKRHYDGLAHNRREKLNEMASKDDLSQVMTVVESLLGEVTRCKTAARKQQLHSQRLSLLHLATNSRRRLAADYFGALRLHRERQMKRNHNRVNALRLQHRTDTAFLRRAYGKLAGYAASRKARRRRMSRHTSQAQFLVRKTHMTLLARYYRSWLYRLGHVNQAGLPVLNAVTLRHMNRRMAGAVLASRHSDRLLRTAYTRLLAGAKKARRRQRNTRSVAYLLRRTAQGFVREHYNRLAAYRRRRTHSLEQATEEDIERWANLEHANSQLAERNGALSDRLRAMEDQVAALEQEVRRERSNDPDLSERRRTRSAASELEVRLQEELDALRRELAQHMEGAKNGEREVGASIASLQKQMQNTSSVLNKLIDRMMAVDDIVASKAPPAATPAGSLAASLRAVSPPRNKRIPSSHMSAQRDRTSFAPPGPPSSAKPADGGPHDHRGASGSALDASRPALSRISPMRHRVPSSSSMSKVMASEQLTLLHATGQVPTPPTSVRKW